MVVVCEGTGPMPGNVPKAPLLNTKSSRVSRWPPSAEKLRAGSRRVRRAASRSSARWISSDDVCSCRLCSKAIAMARSKLFGFKTEDEAFALMMIASAEGKHVVVNET